MIKSSIIAAALMVGVGLTPISANAQERLGDGVMGAAAGAAVGGPIGAVVGGVIGFTNGPHIARGFGVHPCYNHYLARYPYRYHRYASYRYRHYYR